MTQEETTTEDLDYGPCSTTSSVPHPPNTYIGSWGQMIQSVLSLAQLIVYTCGDVSVVVVSRSRER